jgi:hypothetical protein
MLWWGRPVFRRRTGLLWYAPQSRIFEYLTDNLRFIDGTDNFQLSLTMGTFQGINLPDFSRLVIPFSAWTRHFLLDRIRITFPYFSIQSWQADP